MLGDFGVDAENVIRTVSYGPSHAGVVLRTRNGDLETPAEKPFVFRGEEKGHSVSLVTTAIDPGDSVEITFLYSGWPAPESELDILLPPSAIARGLDVVVGDQSWSVSGKSRLTTVDLDS